MIPNQRQNYLRKHSALNLSFHQNRLLHLKRQLMCPRQWPSSIWCAHDGLNNILSKLCVDKATGPDMLPARILRECAEQFCKPLCWIIRRLIRAGRWPREWRYQWISPLFKKGSKHKADKYKGLHLTAVCSKVAERTLNILLGDYLEQSNVSGSTQQVCWKVFGSNDLLAFWFFQMDVSIQWQEEDWHLP